MSFTKSSPSTTARDKLIAEYIIRIGQDVRDIPKPFLIHDDPSTDAETLIASGAPAVEPLAPTKYYEAVDSVVKQSETRVSTCHKYGQSETVDDMINKDTDLAVMEDVVDRLGASYAMAQSASWLNAVKGSVAIKVTKNNADASDIIVRTAEQDGVRRIDAVGGIDQQDNPIPLSLDDITTLIGAHQPSCIGNRAGIAGGMTYQGTALRGKPFMVLRSEDLSGLLAEKRFGSVEIGSSRYESLIKIPFQDTPLTSDTAFSVYRGVPMIEVGLLTGGNDPTTLLDVAGDSIIVDNGDGTYDIEYDIVLSTGDSVKRTSSGPVMHIDLIDNSATVRSITLEAKLNAMRTAGRSIVLLRVTRTVSASTFAAALSSGRQRMQVMDGKTAAKNRLERLKKQGRFYNLHPLKRQRLEKLAFGNDVNMKRNYVDGQFSLDKAGQEESIALFGEQADDFIEAKPARKK